MSPRITRMLRSARKVLAILAIGFPAVWGAFALWYQLPGGQALKAVGVALWSAF